jgi:hypothetical protein
MAKATFRWDDPLDLDGRLTDDERMIQDAARSYAREKLLPRVVEAFRDETFKERVDDLVFRHARDDPARAVEVQHDGRDGLVLHSQRKRLSDVINVFAAHKRINKPDILVYDPADRKNRHAVADFQLIPFLVKFYVWLVSGGGCAGTQRTKRVRANGPRRGVQFLKSF